MICNLKGQAGNEESMTQVHIWLSVTFMWADAQEAQGNETERQMTNVFYLSDFFQYFWPVREHLH